MYGQRGRFRSIKLDGSTVNFEILITQIVHRKKTMVNNYDSRDILNVAAYLRESFKNFSANT